MTDPIALITAADPAPGETPEAAAASRMDAALTAMLAAEAPGEAAWVDDAAWGGESGWAGDEALGGGTAAGAREAVGGGDAGAREVLGGGTAAGARDALGGGTAAGARDAAPRRWAPPAGYRRVKGSDAALWQGAVDLRARVAKGLTPRRGGLALGLAAVVAVVVAVAPGHRLAPAPANAATVLTELSRKVARAQPQTGRYAYSRSLSYISQTRTDGKGGEFVIVVPMEGESWVADDGTVISKGVEHEDQATFPTPADKAAYDAAPKFPQRDTPAHAQIGLKVGGLTAEQIRALPTDPAQLDAAISADPDLTTVAAAAQLLGWPLTPQPVRAALYAVLKARPDAKLVGSVHDPSGRAGVGIQFEDDAWTTLFVFNPATGDLLATRSYGRHEAKGRGTTDWDLTLEQGRRDDAPTPTGPTQNWTGL
jgi:hypothetical protein